MVMSAVRTVRKDTAALHTSLEYPALSPQMLHLIPEQATGGSGGGGGGGGSRVERSLMLRDAVRVLDEPQENIPKFDAPAQATSCMWAER
jgi:hypothetical protein